jgi:hypothetical protein
MTDASPRDARTAWTIGGSLLVAAALFPLITQGVFLPGMGFVSTLLWAGSLTVFAVGWRRSGSVVARRPLGTVALLVAAALPLLGVLLSALVPAPSPSDAEWAVPLWQVIQVLLIAALIVASVQIARAGAVPGPVRWLPLIVVVICTAIELAAVAVFSTPDLSQEIVSGIVYPLSLARPLGELLIGITAIVLAQGLPARRPDDEAVQVYPPEA